MTIIISSNSIILYHKIDSTNATEVPEAEPESVQHEMGDSGDEVSDTTILSEISATEEPEIGISLSNNYNLYLVYLLKLLT